MRRVTLCTCYRNGVVAHARLWRRAASGAPICAVVHGGAWAIPDAQKQRNVDACETAVAAAYAVLKQGGSAVDAVERAVQSLELDESLNAGRGSSLNSEGDPECDSMIMDGALNCGAVAGVQVMHPISLARRVMERTEHTLLIGEGAMLLAAEEPPQLSGRESLVTTAAEEEWRVWNKYSSNVSGLFAPGPSASAGHSDTVGCVALDCAGMLACGTSTGGVVGKRKGRVGDSPLVGSGGYADNGVGAVSTTGHGEAITKVTLARLALWLVERGRTPAEASQEALATMQRRCGGGGGGCGGLIMLTHAGEVTATFNTQRMVWASIESRVGADDFRMRSGIDRDSM